MRKKLIASVGSAVAIALLVAGCGSGGNSETSTAPITKAEFVKKANAVCTKSIKQVETEFAAYLKSQKGKERTKPADVAAAQSEIAETIVIPAKRQLAEEFNALGAPSGDEDQVKAIDEAFEEAVEKVEEDPEKAVSDTTVAFGKSEKLAEEYGISACG